MTNRKSRTPIRLYLQVIIIIMLTDAVDDVMAPEDSVRVPADGSECTPDNFVDYKVMVSKIIFLCKSTLS